MSSFDEYADEFSSLLRQCSSSATNDTATTTSLLEQCQDLLQQMVLEARSTDQLEEKKRYTERCKSYKEQYQLTKQHIERQTLLVSNTNTAASTLQLRDALQSNEVTMVNQNSTLQQSLQSIHDTEQIAASTLEQLHDQRDTLHSTQQKTQTLQSMTQQANTIATNLLKPWWRKGV
jgi:hypothetical protein